MSRQEDDQKEVDNVNVVDEEEEEASSSKGPAAQDVDDEEDEEVDVNDDEEYDDDEDDDEEEEDAQYSLSSLMRRDFTAEPDEDDEEYEPEAANDARVAEEDDAYEMTLDAEEQEYGGDLETSVLASPPVKRPAEGSSSSADSPSKKTREE